MSDLRVLLFFYMVEGALGGYVGMGLIGIRLNLKQFAAVGILQGIVVWLVRGIYTLNEIPFGTHTLFTLFGLIIILYLVVYKNWGVVTLGSLLGFIIIILSESLIVPEFYDYFRLTVEQVYADVWVHILAGYFGDWLLILVAIFLLISKRSLINLKDVSE